MELLWGQRLLVKKYITQQKALSVFCTERALLFVRHSEFISESIKQMLNQVQHDVSIITLVVLPVFQVLVTKLYEKVSFYLVYLCLTI